VEDLTEGPEGIRLSGETSRYVARVLRLASGDPLTLFDGSGWEFDSTVQGIARGRVTVRVQGRRRGKRAPSVEISLGLGLLKGQKSELVLQKAVELGVREIRPMVTSRTVRTVDPERAEQRVVRWEKIAREASRQSGRADVPKIRPVASFNQVVTEAASFDLRILLSERAGQPLRAVARGIEAPTGKILVVAGPEGGFSPEEETLAVGHGFVPVSLGPRTLRAETAAILGVGLVQFEFGDLGELRRTGDP